MEVGLSLNNCMLKNNGSDINMIDLGKEKQDLNERLLAIYEEWW